MQWLLVIPAFFQGLSMLVDEFYFHRRRGLGRWERIGHPVDTLSVMAVYAVLLTAPFTQATLAWFLVLTGFSCLLITKDEFVHQAECLPGEGWLHAVLFVLHPLVLLAGGLCWYLIRTPDAALWTYVPTLKADDLTLALRMQAGIILGFFSYQTVYWNILWTPRSLAAK